MLIYNVLFYTNNAFLLIFFKVKFMRIYEKYNKQIERASTEEDLTRILGRIDEKIKRAFQSIKELKDSIGKLSSNKARVIASKNAQIADHEERLKELTTLRDMLLLKKSELKSDLALAQGYEIIEREEAITRLEEGYELVMKA